MAKDILTKFRDEADLRIGGATMGVLAMLCFSIQAPYSILYGHDVARLQMDLTALQHVTRQLEGLIDAPTELSIQAVELNYRVMSNPMFSKIGDPSKLGYDAGLAVGCAHGSGNGVPGGTPCPAPPGGTGGRKKDGGPTLA